MASSIPTIPGVLSGWAAKQPDKTLFTFVDDKGRPSQALTYAECLVGSQAIAASLARFEAGTRVILAYAPGLDFIVSFLGCLAAGVIPVPVYPPNPTSLDADLPKLCHVAQDSQAAAILTSSSYYRVSLAARAFGLATCRCRRGGRSTWPALEWVVTDRVAARAIAEATTATSSGASASTSQLEAERRPPPDPGSVAFLQYTSGSTSDPKGVMVTHRALLHNVRLIARQLGRPAAIIPPSGVEVSWLPQYHDMGLIGGYLVTLFVGATGYYMSPLSFLRDPLLWLRLISAHGGTHTQAPDFAYALCARRAQTCRAAGSDADRRALADLDLSSLAHAFNAADTVRAASMDAFVAAFAANGFDPRAFSPGYGLAENTVYVSDGGGTRFMLDRAALEGDGRRAVGDMEAVGLGVPPPEVEIAIVDPETRRRCPVDRVGEIWVRSDSKAAGYWGKQELSQQMFEAAIAGEIFDEIAAAGADSVTLLELHEAMQRDLDVKLPISFLVDHKTIRSVAEGLESVLPLPAGADTDMFGGFDGVNDDNDGGDEDGVAAAPGGTLGGGSAYYNLVDLVLSKRTCTLLVGAGVAAGSYVTMAERDVGWYEQPKILFEGPGMRNEGWIKGRMMDEYHGFWITYLVDDLPVELVLCAVASHRELPRSVRYLLLRMMSFNFDLLEADQAGQPRCLGPTKGSPSEEDADAEGEKLEGRGLLACLGYLFYSPLALHGPTMTHGNFHNDVIASLSSSTAPVRPRFWRRITYGIVSVALSIFLLTLSLHYFYYPAVIFFSVHGELRPWEWFFYGGAHMTFMYVSNSAFYRLAHTMALADGVEAPEDMPADLMAATASFRVLWASYHRSWHEFFMRYIFFPVGGGYRGIVVTVGFSLVLHGLGTYWLLWSGFNLVGFVLEKRLLSFAWYRRPGWLVRVINRSVVVIAHVYPFDVFTYEGFLQLLWMIVVFVALYETWGCTCWKASKEE
eukprot:g3973.t1